MTAYLKSIGGLNNKRHSNPLINSEGLGVGVGWYLLIKNLCDELIESGWDKEIIEIKEKFGGLRFTIGETNTELNEIINKFQNLSIQTCEVCGEVGSQTETGWIKTLCGKHKVSREKFVGSD